MDDLSRLAEKLLVLVSHAQGLLARVHTFKVQYARDDGKPRIMLDPVLVPVFKAILKRFPNDGGLSQTQGYDRFMSSHREIMDVCAEHYAVMVAVVEFRETAFSLFSDVTRLVHFSPDWNVDVLENFVRLVSLYARLHIMLNSIEDRKLVAVCYSRCYALANGSSEPSYKKVSDYLVEYESPIAQMQNELVSISGRLGEALLHLKACIDNNNVPMANVRNEGLHNMIQVPSNIKKPSGEDKRLRDMRRFRDVSEGILYGYLVCPSEFAKPQGLEAVRVLLERSFCWDLYHGEPMPFHVEFEALAARSSAKQAKQAISDAVLNSATIAGAFHKERRDYCRLQMRQMLGLLKEKPGLSGPKLSQILSLIGLARDEVLWLFQHLDKPHPQAKKAKFREDDYRDAAITELVYLVEEVKAALLANRAAIRTYYSSYLAVYYRNKLQAALAGPLGSSDVDAIVRRQFDYALETLGSLAQGGEVNLEAVRINWQRTQVYLSLPTTSSTTVSSFAPVVPLMNEIVARTQYVDNLDGLLSSVGGLHELLYYRTELLSTIDLVIKNFVVQSKYASAYVSVITSFVNNVTAGYQREYPHVAARAASLLERVYLDVAARVAQLAHDLAVSNLRLNQGSQPERARIVVARSLADRQAAAGAKHLPPPEPLPGEESGLRLDKDAKALFGLRHILKNLCSVFCDAPNIVIYDTQFSPRAFLIDAVVAKVRVFLSSVVRAPPVPDDSLPPIRRPTAILADIESYFNSLLQIEPYAHIELPALLRDLMLEQTDLHKARKLAALIPNGDLRRAAQRGKPLPAVQGHAFADDAPYLAILALWYVDAGLNRLYNYGALYSPLRDCFLSRPNTPIRFDRFTDPLELQALCQLIGPNGVRHIEERLFKAVNTWIGEVKDYVSRNVEALEVLATSAHQPPRFVDALRRVKHLDELLDRFMSIGYALTLRRLIANALQTATRRTAPHLFDAVANIHAQYPANTFGVQGYAAVDALANAVGLFHNVDTTLRNLVEVHCRDPANDRRIWALMPVLAAASLPALASLESTGFNPNVDAHENNAGFVSFVVDKLTVATLSLTANGDESVIAAAQRSFVEIGATVLLRASLEQQRPREIDSAFLLLHLFTESSPYVKADFLEKCIPYALIRGTMSDVLRRRARKRLTVKEDEAAGF